MYVLKDSFKVEDRPMGFNVIEYREFINSFRFPVSTNL